MKIVGAVESRRVLSAAAKKVKCSYELFQLEQLNILIHASKLFQAQCKHYLDFIR